MTDQQNFMDMAARARKAQEAINALGAGEPPTNWAVVPTDPLKNMIEHSREELATWNRSVAEHKERLASAMHMADKWRTDLREQEAELRDREPEFGARYQHPDGFEYQSVRGRDRWEYRITGTPVFVREVRDETFGMCHEGRCTEHGNIGGPAQSQLEDELSYAYDHFKVVHA